MSKTIGHWHDVCFEHFKNLCEALEKSDGAYEQQMPLASVLDQYDRFNVWAGYNDADQVGHMSLDYRLREARHTVTKDSVIVILRNLNENLKDAISIINGTRPPFEEAPPSPDSDSSDDDEGSDEAVSGDIELQQETELQQLAEGIVKIVAALLKISTVIPKGNVPADSEVAQTMSILNQNSKPKSEIIAERQFNLPLPDDPPVASDRNSSGVSKMNVGPGGVERDVSYGGDVRERPTSADW